MSFIQVQGVDEVEPQHVLEPGEHLLKIVKVEEGVSQNGNNYLRILFTSVQDPDALPVSHILMLVDGNTLEEYRNMWLRSLKQFQEAAGVNFTKGFDTEDLIGTEVWAVLSIEEDEVFGKRNRVTRFTAGK